MSTSSPLAVSPALSASAIKPFRSTRRQNSAVHVAIAASSSALCQSRRNLSERIGKSQAQTADCVCVLTSPAAAAARPAASAAVVAAAPLFGSGAAATAAALAAIADASAGICGRNPSVITQQPLKHGPSITGATADCVCIILTGLLARPRLREPLTNRRLAVLQRCDTGTSNLGSATESRKGTHATTEQP